MAHALHRLSATLVASLTGLHAAAIPAQELPEAPRTLTLDIDSDGRPDRATLVQTEESDAIRLEIFLDAGAAKSGEKRKPDYVKQDFAAGRILGFSSSGNGMLSIDTCYGCGARKSYDETLSVAYREKTLIVSGYSRFWEWYTPFADGTDEFLMGGCRIDYVTGQAWTTEGLDAERPAAGHFAPVALADWSFEKAPAICKFGSEDE